MNISVTVDDLVHGMLSELRKYRVGFTMAHQ